MPVARAPPAQKETMRAVIPAQGDVCTTVLPAKAGIHGGKGIVPVSRYRCVTPACGVQTWRRCVHLASVKPHPWIPAFAGKTVAQGSRSAAKTVGWACTLGRREPIAVSPTLDFPAFAGKTVVQGSLSTGTTGAGAPSLKTLERVAQGSPQAGTHAIVWPAKAGIQGWAGWGWGPRPQRDDGWENRHSRDGGNPGRGQGWVPVSTGTSSGGDANVRSSGLRSRGPSGRPAGGRGCR